MELFTSPAQWDPSVKVMSILLSISVVLYALWGEYFKNTYNEGQKRATKGSDEEGESKAIQLIRVRTSGLISFVTQVVIYFTATEARQKAPLISLAFVACALLATGQIQFSLEKRIRGLEAGHRDQFRMTLKAALWASASMATYIVCIFLFSAGALVGAKAVGMRPEFTLLAVVAANILGTLTALGLTFALAPFYLRKSLPCSKLQPGDLQERIRSCFSRAKLTPPHVWILEMDQFKFNNAMIAGFSRGKGLFAPALFMSRSIAERFSPDEIESIVLHEVSHLDLKHLRKRFTYTMKILAGTAAMSGVIFTLANLTLPPPLTMFMGLLIGIFAFIYPFLALKNQVAIQEIEADRHAVIALEADLGAFSRALRKLDLLNHHSGDRRDPNAVFSVNSAHPLTEERIRMLTEAVEFHRELQAAANREAERENREAA